MIISLCVFAVSIKLSSLPMLIFAIYIFGAQLYSKNIKESIIILTVLILSLSPFIIRNIISSGYLIYPFPFIDLFNVDWKIPQSIALSDKQWIESWARMPGVHPDLVLGHFSYWFPMWLKASVIYRKSIYLPLIFSWLLLFLCLFRSQRTFSFELDNYKKYLVAFIVNICGIAFWLYTAPDLRFGYSYILILVCLIIGTFIVNNCIKPKCYLMALCIIICASIFVFANIIIDLPKVSKNNILLQADYPEVKLIENNHNGRIIYSPQEGDQCWYAPLPCSPSNNLSTVKFRGEKLSDGFIYRNIDKPVQYFKEPGK